MRASGSLWTTRSRFARSSIDVLTAASSVSRQILVGIEVDHFYTTVMFFVGFLVNGSIKWLSGALTLREFHAHSNKFLLNGLMGLLLLS